jgi:dihydrofolate reductase
MKMKISIIVSVSENWVIGKNNKLLWKLSDDLKRFKKLTSGHPVIMGQKTFESLPNGALPNRTNIVLTDDPNFSAKDTIVAYNLIDSLEKAKQTCKTEKNCEVFIIGGGMIYKQFLDYADCIYLTTVHTNIDGDVFFPELNTKQWKLVSEEFKEKDDNNEYDHTYKIYNRK